MIEKWLAADDVAHTPCNACIRVIAFSKLQTAGFVPRRETTRFTHTVQPVSVCVHVHVNFFTNTNLNVDNGCFGPTRRGLALQYTSPVL